MQYDETAGGCRALPTCVSLNQLERSECSADAPAFSVSCHEFMQSSLFLAYKGSCDSDAQMPAGREGLNVGADASCMCQAYLSRQLWQQTLASSVKVEVSGCRR